MDEAVFNEAVKAKGLKEPDTDQSNGFYDFMRSDTETIVGVRWSPFPNAEFVLGHLPDTPLLTVEPNGILKSLRVWLERPVEFDESISDDQLFWYNRVLVNEVTGELTITFALPDQGISVDRLRAHFAAVGDIHDSNC